MDKFVLIYQEEARFFHRPKGTFYWASRDLPFFDWVGAYQCEEMLILIQFFVILVVMFSE